MRELIDCHIHTERCGHASGTAAEYVDAAVERGLAGIVMTEHLPIPAELDPDGVLALAEEDLPVYVQEVLMLRERRPEISIVLGAESDWLPDHRAFGSRIRAQARELGVAVLLGSVHFIGEWAFDDPNEIARWDSHEVDAVWEAYFERWCDAARSQVFDVMAHPDLPKKFGHRPSRSVDHLYEYAAEAAAEGGVAIEVSTGGLRKPVGELYPGPELLAAFWRSGVPATVGSDAHCPAEVGYRIDAAYDALAAAGYREVRMPFGDGDWKKVAL